MILFPPLSPFVCKSDSSLAAELLLDVTSMVIDTEITDVPHMPRLPSISVLGRDYSY
ncbi:hypothetical protein PISMIDRAFT_679088 [Pisolithus microcarpus 441]|uniref:Uncharacterized protein n=1 Tax=Pisolithus microcarpus 441 TaxID=765257 RepID=A0A0C9ZVG1_9AGAM|nr:hypothetical protein PISMIDRAFT_679088 [Pisolithus microcarpus 441]